MSKFSIIGGNPYRGYTGTTTFTALRVVGVCDTRDEVKAIVDQYYEECGGLLIVIDLATGQPADEVPFGNEPVVAPQKVDAVPHG